MKKFITTTLPYSNAARPHVGAAFEFVLADVIAEYWRKKIGPENVRLNIGLDEHGQKIAQQAREAGLEPQAYCDQNAESWIATCKALGISYDNFYRTTDQKHKENVLRFTEQLAPFIHEGDYEGLYCVGCESYKTQKEVIGGRCAIHGYDLPLTKERVHFFDIKRFAASIEDRLSDKTLSNELRNILANDFDFPITRKNVEWAIPFKDVTLHCWWEALTNYLFAAGLHDENDDFAGWWANSLQICGKDNLKFQAYIFQAMLLAAGLPQTKEILIHGTILDKHGIKMSKSLGNVVDPVVQLEKYGKGALRYYLTFGLNTYGDSDFSEERLVKLWNDEIVGGFGNLVARSLHLLDTLNIEPKGFPESTINVAQRVGRSLDLIKAFEAYDFHRVHELLVAWTGHLNARINNERPFDKALPIQQRKATILEVYKDVCSLARFYNTILKDPAIPYALDSKKKAILFERIQLQNAVA